MNVRIILPVCVMIAAMCSCSGEKKTQESMEGKGKTLIVYYSQTGATKSVAEELGNQLGAEMVSIEAVDPYDQDYAATVERWRQEKEAGKEVAIKPLDINIEEYDTIFLGFPVWGGTVASPVATFLKENQLKGKTIVTFATFGSGGFESATSDVKSAQPDATVIEGYGVRNARLEAAPAELNRFLIERGFKAGEIEKLPDYGENQPVTEKETEVFNAACGDYQFPLGTPVTFEKRTYGGIDDYKFIVKTQSPDGNESTATIFVVAPEGEKAVFTRVVR